jgi:hypothetical protein
MTDASHSNKRVPLPSFLKVLTSNGVPIPRAMSVAGKMFVASAILQLVLTLLSYKEFNTPAMLGQLTELKLKAAGVDDREDRRLSIAALRKAGYIGKQKKTTDGSGDIAEASNTDQKSAIAGPSKPSTVQVLVRVQIHGEIDSSYFSLLLADRQRQQRRRRGNESVMIPQTSFYLMVPLMRRLNTAAWNSTKF